jgi:hypothetical protein
VGNGSIGVSAGSPFGTQVTADQALRRAAGALIPPYEIVGTEPHRLALHASGGELPAVTLRLTKDRRLFSRTFLLSVEATVAGRRVGGDVSATLTKTGLRRRTTLQHHGPPEEAEEWARRLDEAGVLDGVRTMTNVASLEAGWDAAAGAAHLRLTTLAGALIGTTPTSSIAVPLEPEDVRGLLGILRALAASAREA